MKYLLSESQTNQTIIKFCYLAFDIIRKSVDLRLDEMPDYTSLESLLVIESIDNIEFFNVEKKNSSNKIGFTFTVDCKIFYKSLNYINETYFEHVTYDIKWIIKQRFKIDIKINIVDTIHEKTDPDW